MWHHLERCDPSIVTGRGATSPRDVFVWLRGYESWWWGSKQAKHKRPLTPSSGHTCAAYKLVA